jgi:uncharacterized protein YuzE
MKFHYYPETDTLYIELRPESGVDSQEVSPAIVLDFNSDGRVVGIDVDQAAKNVDLSRFEAVAMPIVGAP